MGRIRRLVWRDAGIQLIVNLERKVDVNLSINIVIVLLFPAPKTEVPH